MEPRKHSVDLGKELTCSICTELLYQPLTLLDCLHTYCGACLKEWFLVQAAKIERAPTPPPPDAVLFTCPSCRSSVRDTKHNATVATLLDMLVAANPSKARSEADKKEMQEKYKPGDQILPKVKTRQRTTEEARAEEEDRRLMEEVREMSLREAVAAATPVTPHSRQSRRYESRGEERARSSADQRGPRSGRENSNQGSADQLTVDDEARRRRSESRQRQVEHQSSLRSLIGSQMSERDIEKEIEEFARQIQEEGLLEGLDLDNIDLSRDDELSRRITEAYRRRQRGRSRQEQARRSNASGQSGPPRPAESVSTDSRLRPSSARPQSRQRTHSRSTSEVDDRSRPPLSVSANNLEVRQPEPRTRRRTTSGGRSATTPVVPSTTDTRPAARSQTDLTLRTQSSDPTASVAPLRINRSSSSGAASSPAHRVELPINSTGNNGSFASRLPQGNQATSPASSITPELVEIAAANRVARSNQPGEVTTSSPFLVSSPVASPTVSGNPRTRPQLYEEPSISCSRCDKAHIEYDVHYNCRQCADGKWNMCTSCYRAGKGCLYWFGFGYGAWKKWEKHKEEDQSASKPHMLNAGRYIRPAVPATRSDSGKMVTPEDPKARLETGTFCSKCFTWTNDCFWRCDVCNEGDWGFCNNCVNQGNSCSHRLVPLAHEMTLSRPPSQMRASRSPSRPPTATITSGPQAPGIGPFKPLTFNTRCDVCNKAILPSQLRYHCFSCTSALVQDASPGDYDICSPCYDTLEAQGKISPENGQAGWRRCLKGHRMAIIGFEDGKIGYQRYVQRDMVGGRALRSQPLENIAHPDFQKWSWFQGDEKLERIVSTDVSHEAPSSLGSITYATTFPPDGGEGMSGHAIWPWYPQADAEDELMFPRGADIQEIRDINGDWFFGTFMGAKGLFPAPYVRMP